MEELIKLDVRNEEFPVDARELHEKLEVQTRFDIWINRKIEEYGFVEGNDFRSTLSKSTGGRRATKYLLSLDTSKELAMVENNDIGKRIRRYFIESEKELRKNLISRSIGKVIRRELTDALQESGLNDKMHGHGYSTFTDLIYKLVLGMSAKKYREINGLSVKANIREHINQYQLHEITRLEKVAEGMVDIGMNYEEIKSILSEKFLGLKATPKLYKGALQ
jgi:phage anti-repressor protein